MEATVIGTILVNGDEFPMVRVDSTEDDGLINAFIDRRPPRPYIALNDAALALPQHLRLAIIGHEVGHEICEHWRSAGRDIRKEIEADQFAVELAGLCAVRQLLMTMVRTLKKRGLCAREVELRLQVLPTPPPKKRQAGIPGRRRKRRK